LQVLGVPGQPVFFTSALDESIGNDVTPISSVPAGGNWGGIVFRNNLDYAEGRTVLEREGIFLNFINHADIRYGGGDVTVNSISQRFTPIHMTEARPTISYNTITRSADAAMSADPKSFLDTRFQGPDFTADYERIGPHIRRNTLATRLPNGSGRTAQRAGRGGDRCPLGRYRYPAHPGGKPDCPGHAGRRRLVRRRRARGHGAGRR
jgi:hypothetical protein